MENETIEKTSRFEQVTGFVYYRILLILLIIGIVWTVVQIANGLLERQQLVSQTESRSSAYAETATAIVTLASTPIGADVNTSDLYVRQRRIMQSQPQQFATNTPMPQATATPAPINPSDFHLPQLFFPEDPRPDLVSVTAIPTRVPSIQRDYNLVNILLLGGDDELNPGELTRTDTMIVVSVNLDTQTVSMISLPRDLFVYIPSGTMQRLNVTYGIGDNIGWQPDGGFGLLRQTIFYNFGINVHYFAKVNFTGFEQIVDTLGGIEVSVECAYRDYYPVDDFDITRPIEENYKLRTLDVGYYTMGGQEALWFARTRKVSDDFDRGRRQQKLLRAIFRKARDTGQLENIPSLWSQVTEVVETNLDFQTILGLLPIALNIDPTDIQNFVLIRWYHTTPWQTPSGDYVQLPMYEVIAPLMYNFYQPPTNSQVSNSVPDIAVVNGTGNDRWDWIASERLISEQLGAIAIGNGNGEMHTETILIDHVGDEKGSLVPDIVEALGIRPENVRIELDPNRNYDYEVIVGQNHNFCTYNVLPVEQFE